MKKFFLVLLSLLFMAQVVPGQSKSDSTKIRKDLSDCKQGQIGDLFRKKGKPEKPPKSFSALVLPNISSNPTNGFILGVGGALGWLMGDKSTTNVSSAPFTLAITSKQQLISFVKPNIYTKNNTFYLQGDFRFYLYSQPTFGLGTNSPDSGAVSSGIHWEGYGGPEDSVSFPMKFNYLKIHQIVNKAVVGELYAGIGYHLDYYYSIEDEYLDLTADPPKETPHHYNTSKYGFDSSNYILSGISLNVLYDTRDNMINPYEGIYANINYRINPVFLGSDQASSSLWTEFRTYIGLSERRPRNVLGFWLFGDFNISGNMPYLTMPYLGEDQRTRSGRGYTNGRYRGKNMVYGEVEWRFPISPCSQILGGVLFVNAVTTDNPNTGIGLFEYVRPGIGVGVRVMVNKYFRTNINLDFAIGAKSSGFYFSGQETF